MLICTGYYSARQWLAEITCPIQKSFIRETRTLDFTGDIRAERLRSSIRLAPGVDEYRVLLGKYYVYQASRARCSKDKRHLLKQAGDEYAQALLLNPSYTEVLAYLAWVDCSSGRPFEGIGRLERAIQLDPHNYFNHLFYGICIANFIRTLPSGLTEMYCYRAEEEFRRGLDLHPGMAGQPAVRTGRARLYLEKGDREAAIAQLEGIRVVDAATLPCHLMRADLYLQAGNEKKAIGRYMDLWQNPDLSREEKEMIIDSLSNHAGDYPDNGELKFLLGRIYVEQGDYDKARGVLHEVVSVEPGNAEAHYLLGRVYEYTGDRQAAYEAYERTLHYNPRHPDASQGIIRLYKEMD
ncbi:MAG: tetratricopeptide repeat protein [bacterium]